VQERDREDALEREKWKFCAKSWKRIIYKLLLLFRKQSYDVNTKNYH